MLTPAPEDFASIARAFGWPTDVEAAPREGGVYAVRGTSTPPGGEPSECVTEYGVTPAAALDAYRWQVTLRCAAASPALRLRIDAARAALAADEVALELVAEAVAPPPVAAPVPPPL